MTSATGWRDIVDNMLLLACPLMSLSANAVQMTACRRADSRAARASSEADSEKDSESSLTQVSAGHRDRGEGAIDKANVS